MNLAELSLPAMGQKKVDIMHLLPWPIYDLLSPENFHNLIDSSKMPDIASVPVFDHFESPSEKFKVYRALNQREMLEFVLYSGPDDVFWGVNGMFCLLKPDGTLRLLCDNRRGNSPLISMARFQALYAERVKGDSRYPAKLLDLVNASRFSDMPPGAMLKTESDLSDFFHMLLLPPHMRKHQIFGVVRACDVGLPGNHLLVARGTTQCMGGTFATFIAQAVHENCLAPALLLKVIFRRPEYTSDHHRRDYDRVVAAADEKGMIRASAVPKHLLDNVLRQFGPAVSSDPPAGHLALSGALSSSDFLVPASAFLLEPASPSDPSSHVVASQGFDMRRGDMALSLEDAAAGDGPVLCPFAWLLYIDDQNHIHFRRAGVSDCVIESLANIRLMIAVAVYKLVGFFLRQRKLHWADLLSRAPTKSLGYMVDMTTRYTEFYVPTHKLHELAKRTRALVKRVRKARKAGSRMGVSLELIQHLMGLWVWAILVRRCILSVFSFIFRAMASGHKVIFLSERVLAELEMVANLAPLMVGRSRDMCSTVGTFDASLPAYGVAVRRDCPAEVLAELFSGVERKGRYVCFSTELDGSASASRFVNRVTERADAAAQFMAFDWKSKANPWVVVRSARWRSPRPRHIQVGESLAGGMCLDYHVSCPSRSFGRKVLCIGDNQPSLGALSKGRTSVPDINRICRRVCATHGQLCADVVPFWVWIRSCCNPSDAPSKWPTLSRVPVYSA